MHNCLNVVSGRAGDAGAVLIRAVEPLEGLDAMYEARVAGASTRSRGKPGRTRLGDALTRGPADAVLASGPGRLCAAFGVDRGFNGTDLCAGTSLLRLERARTGARPALPAWTTRVGVDHAGEPWSSLPWRLIDRASGSLSGPASRNASSD
jgi:DNA-3-methyladenine glycosylase